MPAVGIEAQITEALLQRLAALTLNPTLKVAYPNVAFPKSGDTKPATYLDAHQLRGPTEGVGISAWDEHQGIWQIDVVYSEQDGLGKPTEIADSVAEWFKRGTRLTNGSVRVDIDEPPQIAAPVVDGSYTRTPVSIRYRVFTR
jgi:GH25 family lysozyme M1 (1,4-beta-N-acetylmuramidase)